MNNYFNVLLLVIFCNAHAARYEFENGTKLDVPDTIVIHNDLGEDFRVYEMDRDHKGKCSYSGYRLFELSKSKKLVLHDMNRDIEVKLYEKCCAKRTYTLLYPAFTDDNECVTKDLNIISRIL